MNRREAFVLLLIGLALLTAGLTWRFGWLGLLIPGVVVFIYTVGSEFEDVKEVSRDE